METIKWICSNSGNVSAVFCHTNPEPSLVYNREGVETERAVPKGVFLWQRDSPAYKHCAKRNGDENRSEMNPGAVGSNPAVDTIKII